MADAACGVHGLHPSASGARNARALQRAIDDDTHPSARGRPISITCVGTYDVSTAVILRSNTHLTFIDGAVLRKVRTQPRSPF